MVETDYPFSDRRLQLFLAPVASFQLRQRRPSVKGMKKDRFCNFISRFFPSYYRARLIFSGISV